jgi:rubrerythrin
MFLTTGVAVDSEYEERAFRPPSAELSVGKLPLWACPVCTYTTPGNADAPFSGDGTCPDHPRSALRLKPPAPSTD